MGATQEMIKQNVFYWLDALIVGAKAMSTPIQCGTDDWRDEASVYCGSEYTTDGILTVNIHGIERVAKAVEFDLQHQDFTPANEYYAYFTGEDFFIYNGVKFSDMVNGHFSDDEEKKRRAEREEWKENARKQSSNSGTSENAQVADE